jgi:hypothetical protein
MIYVLILWSVPSPAQSMDLEVGGGVHFAYIVRDALGVQVAFSGKERYFTAPGRVFHFRIHYGAEDAVFRMFLTGQFSTFTPNVTSMLKQVEADGGGVRKNESIDLNAMFTGTSIFFPQWGRFHLRLNMGLGVSHLSVPAFFFSCTDCTGDALRSYTAHGGLGFGALLEKTLMYKVADMFNLALSYSLQGGSMHNTSIQSWRINGQSRDIVTSNKFSWLNSLVTLGVVLPLSRTSSILD